MFIYIIICLICLLSILKVHEENVCLIHCYSPSTCHSPILAHIPPHSSTLAWKIPWTEEAGGLQPMGSLGVGHFHFSLSCIGEGNGNPLQCCCLENPRDGGAWWAAVYGVTQSRTRLKRLSSSSRCSVRVGSFCPCSLHLYPGFPTSWSSL